MQIIQNAKVLLIKRGAFQASSQKEYLGQELRIKKPTLTTSMGVDGYQSPARQVGEIQWRGATVDMLVGVANIVIKLEDGSLVLEAEINRFYDAPKAVDGCLLFKIL